MRGRTTNRGTFLTPSLRPRPAGGLIVLRRINYHLLSSVAEARTKRRAPALASWKRNPLVARCDINADAEVDATAEQCARGCTATSPTMAATTRHRRRDALQSLQLFTEIYFTENTVARLCHMRGRGWEGKTRKRYTRDPTWNVFLD